MPIPILRGDGGGSMKKVRLGEVCEIISGSTPKTGVAEYWDGEFKWITPAELNEETYIINDSVRHITELGIQKTGLKSFPEGTVILSSRAPIGKTAIAGCEMYCNQGFKNLICSKEIYNKYLYFFLTSKTEYLNSLGRGATFKEISKKIVESIEINLPPLDEQKNVAEQFEQLNELFKIKNAELRELDNLVKSRFIEMFGETGKQVPLTDYVWFQEGPGVRSVDFRDEGTILLTGSNINDNTISFGYKSDRYISEELSEGKYAHFMCDKDDILVVSSAIDPAKFDRKVVIVKEDKKYCLNTGIIRFKPNQQFLTNEYFSEFLKTGYFKQQVSSEMRGIAQMHFGPSHLKQMTILLPDSIETQNQFANFVKQTDKLKFDSRFIIKYLRKLREKVMKT